MTFTSQVFNESQKVSSSLLNLPEIVKMKDFLASPLFKSAQDIGAAKNLNTELYDPEQTFSIWQLSDVFNGTLNMEKGLIHFSNLAKNSTGKSFPWHRRNVHLH